MTVRTRFAPSPTGYLHIGGIRTALFSWLYARHHQGTFILRIEDTDRERSTAEAVAVILEGMQWMGLDHDEGPFYQTQHFDRYREVIKQLLETNHAYYCYCSREALDVMRNEAMARGEKPKYNGKCRSLTAPPEGASRPVVRFCNPLDGAVMVEDLIQGTVRYQNAELDDLIIARPDGTPTYNLTVVVDDMDMEITHVIRGDDHLNNTPRQINIFAALGVAPPAYAHVPMILGPDGKKLSKRHGTVSVLQYRDEGILPEAMLNYLVRLGWSHGDQEIFSIQEMIDWFDIADVNKSAAALNPDKLLWLNQHYLKSGDVDKLSHLFADYLHKAGIATEGGPPVRDLFEVQRERFSNFTEMAEQSRAFFEEFAQYEENAAKKHLRPEVQEPLSRLHTVLLDLQDWQADPIHAAIESVAAEFDVKLGKIAQPLRVAVTGTAVSPSIDKTLWLLGKQRVSRRLKMALEYIETHTTT
jgi:glutamyl-tRNA synthetase